MIKTSPAYVNLQNKVVRRRGSYYDTFWDTLPVEEQYEVVKRTKGYCAGCRDLIPPDPIRHLERGNFCKPCSADADKKAKQNGARGSLD